MDTIAEKIGEPADNIQVLIELKVKEKEKTANAAEVDTNINYDKMVKGLMMDLDLFKTINQGAPKKSQRLKVLLMV